MIDTKELRRICDDAGDFHSTWTLWVGEQMRVSYLPRVAEYFTAAIEHFLDSPQAQAARRPPCTSDRPFGGPDLGLL